MTTETKIDTGTDQLLCVIRDRVAIITLNRPEARNSLSDELTPALRTMIKTCGENREVGAQGGPIDHFLFGFWARGFSDHIARKTPHKV